MSINVNFKSEEEVREYLKNLGIEYRFGCFKEKKPDVCHLLGDFLETIDRNQEKAFKVYQDNCDSGNFSRSCYKCANYTALGQGGQKKDLVKALGYYEKSCNLGFPLACFRAGLLSVIQSKSPNPTRSFQQGLKLLEKGCEGENDEACYHLSGIYMDGYEKENIAKDMKRSFEYALKACNLDNMYACNNLSMMYRRGDGVEVNSELASKYKRKAKELQDDKVKQQQLTFQQGLSRT